MRGNRVGELRIVVDLRKRAQHLGRNLFVELNVVLELAHRRARESLDLVLIAERFLDALDLGLEVVLLGSEALDLCPGCAFDQHLHGAVGQLQELQHGGERTHGVDRGWLGIVVPCILLRGKQDLPVRPHHFVERVYRFLAADKERHDHVWEDDNVAKRQYRECLGGWVRHVSLL